MKKDILFTEIIGKGGNIGRIILNRPQALNALNSEMCQSLQQQLTHWENDNNIKAVVISGEGDRAFCAGGDIKRFYVLGKDEIETSREFFWHEYRMNDRIFTFKKPYISLLHGITMGGGIGVSIHGSHIIASTDLAFAMPETSIGFFPDIGASYFLPRLPNCIGIYLGLTGNIMGAGDAKAIGIVDSIVARDQFDEVINKLAQTNFSADAHTSVLNIINKFGADDEPTSAVLGKEVQINKCFSQQTVEEIISELEQQHHAWFENIRNTLLTRSPTSLKVTLRELQKGATQEFADCMRMEYRIANRFLHTPDFYEGIRAALIDKDREPKWNPAKLSEVTKEQIAAYFEPI